MSRKLEKKIGISFVEALDPAKIYFLDGEKAKIKKALKSIMNKTSFFVKKGKVVFLNQKADCSPIFKVFDMYKKKVKDRFSYMASLMNKRNFVFKPNVSLNLSSKRERFSKKKDLVNFYQKYAHFQLSQHMLDENVGKKTKKKRKRALIAKAKKKVIKSHKRTLKRVEGMKPYEVLELYLMAFAEALDPHSGYLSKEDLEDFQILMRLSLEGIGATLGSEDGFTVVKELVPGGVAKRTGRIRIEDKIIAVAQGKKGSFENIVEMRLAQVVRKIRGRKGTVVRLKILRKTPKGMKTFVVSLKRDKIKLKDKQVFAAYTTKKVAGKKKKFAVINVPSFYSDTSGKKGVSVSKDLERVLKEVKKNKADGVILDLSKNGGGSLDEAVKVAGLFISKGNIVKQSFPGGRYQTLKDEDPSIVYKGPLVILVSRLSASASEIVSGTLQGYKRALVVGGDHTFGKGSIQSVDPLPAGLGALKTTVGMFYVSSGASTQLRGVRSDIPFPHPYSHRKFGEKVTDNALPFDSIKSFFSPKAIAQGVSKINAKIVPILKRKSQSRVKKNKEFAKITKKLKEKNKKGYLTKLSELMSEQEKDKKESQTEAKLTKRQKKKKYLKELEIRESLNILSDYVALNKRIKT